MRFVQRYCALTPAKSTYFLTFSSSQAVQFPLLSQISNSRAVATDDAWIEQFRILKRIVEDKISLVASCGCRSAARTRRSTMLPFPPKAMREPPSIPPNCHSAGLTIVNKSDEAERAAAVAWGQAHVCHYNTVYRHTTARTKQFARDGVSQPSASTSSGFLSFTSAWSLKILHAFPLSFVQPLGRAWDHRWSRIHSNSRASLSIPGLQLSPP